MKNALLFPLTIDYWKAFTQLHFEQMDSMVPLGRFHGIPVQQHPSVCEALAHYIFQCQLYTDITEHYFELLLKRIKYLDLKESGLPAIST